MKRTGNGAQGAGAFLGWIVRGFLAVALCTVGLAAVAVNAADLPGGENPFTVKNVKFQQRYPWNGLVDISFDLAGAGKVALNVTALTNGVPLCEAKAITGARVIDLGESGSETNGVKLVWNAADDLPAGFMSSSVKIDVTAKKFVPKKHTVNVTLKSQSGAPVAGEVCFCSGGEKTAISIAEDGTGSGEVPEGKGTWTVDAQYCETTPTTPAESTIDQDGLTIDLRVQRQTKDVDVVALFANYGSHPPVPRATIGWVLSDDYGSYGEGEVEADDEGKAQFKDVELGLWLYVWGEGSFYDPDFDGGNGWMYQLDCEDWLEPDEISEINEGDVKELLFEDNRGV